METTNKNAKYRPEINVVSLRVLLLSFIDTFCILNDSTDVAMDELLQCLFFKNIAKICVPS